MVNSLLVLGLLVAVFVGFNIGGSSTGVAFGPSVGSRTIPKVIAAALMTVFALIGGWTIGRGVIKTLGGRIVPADDFTLAVSVAVLFFVGISLLVSNLFGVPASTSMTTVGAIAGFGVARGVINEDVMLEIVSWWIVAPIVAFWTCAVIGRYFYPHLDARFSLDRSATALITLDRSYPIPRPQLAPEATSTEILGGILVVSIGCFMAFSAGASNVGNAVAPLVGSGAVRIQYGILLAGAAIGLGSFTIARRTLDTVGSDLTDLPLLAALIVEIVSATLISFLSAIDIPASLAVSATMCIVGLGWGRASRQATVSDAAAAVLQNKQMSDSPGKSVTSNGAGGDQLESVPEIGEADPDALALTDLYNPAATGRVIALWILTPTVSTVSSYLLFELVPFFGTN